MWHVRGTSTYLVRRGREWGSVRCNDPKVANNLVRGEQQKKRNGKEGRGQGHGRNIYIEKREYGIRQPIAVKKEKRKRSTYHWESVGNIETPATYIKRRIRKWNKYPGRGKIDIIPVRRRAASRGTLKELLSKTGVLASRGCWRQAQALSHLRNSSALLGCKAGPVRGLVKIIQNPFAS